MWNNKHEKRPTTRKEMIKKNVLISYSERPPH